MIQPAAQPLPIAPPRLTVFDTGAEQCPQGQLPGAAEMTPEEAEGGLNPLQYVPVVGMIYRAITGEPVPPPLIIACSVVSSARCSAARSAWSAPCCSTPRWSWPASARTRPARPCRKAWT